MRNLASSVVVALCLPAVYSQLVVPQLQQPPVPQPLLDPESIRVQQEQQRQQQHLVMPPPPQPQPLPPGADTGAGPGAGTVMLSDVLGRDRSINVFAGFTRDFAAITHRFDDVAQNSTILAPRNDAIEALPRKPWEDPQDYDGLGADAYEGTDGRARAQRNLRRFVEAHIIPVSPWPAGYKARPLAGGAEVWWETTADGKKVIQPGNIEVDSVASTVANGQVWIIKGVRNYSS
ncbi:fas1 domain containing protein [Niveomyces insectorum RCEF 264]|uniref:Fas1 domain containing protein n=1 Tax=Niveomyces insectorum RCEF 264 TaxID=1081102 RepID=A0A167MAT8_9HYPO|nr:fas1 domain containing protein [Niveomyces insectorum RCEF 264]